MLLPDRVKQQIAQTNQNLSGENLLQTLLVAKNKPGFDSLTFTGEIERVGPDAVFKDEESMSISIANGIRVYDFPGIFRLSPLPRDQHRFNFYLFKLCQKARDLQDLWLASRNKTNRASFERSLRDYNTALNFLQQHLRTDTCDADIEAKRELIRSMRFYQDIYRFRDSIPSQQPAQLAKSPAPEVPTRAVNYDGMKILSTVVHRIRIPKTQHMLTKKSGGGVAFGFYSKEEVIAMFMDAVEKAGVDDLKCVQITGRSNFSGGALWTLAGQFYLELSFVHNFSLAKLPSTSSKIKACLLNLPMRSSDLERILNLESELASPANLHAIGPYLGFHLKVQKKVKELMNASFGRPDFGWICIDCYRPSCNHWNVLRKPAEGERSVAKCTQCKIAEFCLKCTKASHGGECDRLDEATQQWKLDNTRPCPRCHANVQKDGGCNHMRCHRACGAHFCWLCNELYEANDVNGHYIGTDPYGACSGQPYIPPAAPPLVAAPVGNAAASGGAAGGGAVGGGAAGGGAFGGGAAGGGAAGRGAAGRGAAGRGAAGGGAHRRAEDLFQLAIQTMRARRVGNQNQLADADLLGINETRAFLTILLEDPELLAMELRLTIEERSDLVSLVLEMIA